MVEAAEVQAVESLIEKLKEDSSLIYDPKLAVFKDFILSWGGKVPESKPKPKPEPKAAPEPEPAKVEEEEEEEPEEPEEDDPEQLEKDPEPYPSQGPSGEIELTDDQMDKQGELKQAAAEAMEDGDVSKALEKMTQAFEIGNVSAMMFAKRAEVLLKLKKPCACIADCDAALKINPDSGKAYRVRGKAHRLLGHWEEAHQDLAESQKLDFDDDTAELQKFVDAKYKKIAERKNRDRIKAEKKKEQERKRRKEEAQRAYEEAKKAPSGYGDGGGFPGGFPGGLDPSMLSGIMNDPELMKAFSDPRMAAVMQDIMSNPGNIGKYQNDPEVMALINKVMGAFSKGGGMPGGMPGATPGAGSGGPTVEEVPEATNVDEVD